MANPQLEDGYTLIANEILEILSRVNLGAYEMRVLMFLIRKTYGWRKKSDWISISQFLRGTGLTDRRYAHRTLKSLENKNMIVICRDDKKHPTYGFQKDYEKWKLPSLKGETLEHMVVRERREKKGVCRDDKMVPVEAPTKETLTKETLKKREERVSSSLLLSSSLKDERFKGISWLLDSREKFKDRLQAIGYHLSEPQVQSIHDQILQVIEKTNDIHDQDIEIIMELLVSKDGKLRLEK